ncbi:MAG: TIGR03986 family CRISPR-associated RAMP protein, partial [Pseudanabaena sp.]
FQHYLVQDNVNPKNLKHYASNPPAKEKAGDTTIRGHKLYWHKEQVVDQSQDANSDTQTSLIKPINPNPATTFTFDIHFENLSRVELGTLLWVLSIGGDKAKEFGIGKTGEDYRLSLGMGKPLGMGAVKIDPTLYISDRQSRYYSLFNTHNNQWTVSESEASISEYLQAFEKYVLNEKTGIAETDHPQGRMAENLKEIPRIEM